MFVVLRVIFMLLFFIIIYLFFDVFSQEEKEHEYNDNGKKKIKRIKTILKRDKDIKRKKERNKKYTLRKAKTNN